MAERFVDAPALRESVSVKVVIVGPSGSGKTTGALLAAYGITGDWRRIIMVDTEGDSGTHPCGQAFDGVAIPGGEGCAPEQTYRRLALSPPYHPDRMVEVVEQYEEERDATGAYKYDCIVWDSMSHVWNGAGGTLEMVDKLGNAGWKTMTPKFRRFIDAVRLSRLHLVGTMRTKTEMEYVTKTDEATGKSRVVEIKKLGLKAVMRDEVDYEFTTIIRLDMAHLGTADKDRTREFADRPPQPISAEAGRILAKWCRGGVSEVGSVKWMESKLDVLASYAGSLEGLKTLWGGVAQHVSRIPTKDFARLTAAKDAGKARLQSLGRTE